MRTLGYSILAVMALGAASTMPGLLTYGLAALAALWAFGAVTLLWKRLEALR